MNNSILRISQKTEVCHMKISLEELSQMGHKIILTRHNTTKYKDPLAENHHQKILQCMLSLAITND